MPAIFDTAKPGLSPPPTDENGDLPAVGADDEVVPEELVRAVDDEEDDTELDLTAAGEEDVELIVAVERVVCELDVAVELMLEDDTIAFVEEDGAVLDETLMLDEVAGVVEAEP